MRPMVGRFTLKFAGCGQDWRIADEGLCINPPRRGFPGSKWVARKVFGAYVTDVHKRIKECRNSLGIVSCRYFDNTVVESDRRRVQHSC